MGLLLLFSPSGAAPPAITDNAWQAMARMFMTEHGETLPVARAGTGSVSSVLLRPKADDQTAQRMRMEGLIDANNADPQLFMAMYDAAVYEGDTVEYQGWKYTLSAPMKKRAGGTITYFVFAGSRQLKA